MEQVFFVLKVKGLAIAKPFNAKTDSKKLACVATSSARQAKIEIITVSTFSCGTGLFFYPYIWDVLSKGFPPGLKLRQGPDASVSGFFFYRDLGMRH